MSTLIKLVEGQWRLINASPLPNWHSPDAWIPGEPLLMPVDREPQSDYGQAALIGVDFPAFTDGRGLSLAVLLRTRIGYTGELRAVGAIHEDLLHYMIRCGFDALQLPAGRDARTALRLLKPYSAQYQDDLATTYTLSERVQGWA